MTDQYGIRFPGGQVAPLPSLSSARGARNAWAKARITTTLVQHNGDSWQPYIERSSR